MLAMGTRKRLEMIHYHVVSEKREAYEGYVVNICSGEIAAQGFF